MPNDVDVNSLTLTFVDYSKEKSTTRVNTLQFVDGVTYSTARNLLIAGIEDLTLGTVAQRTESLVTRESNSFPTDPAAQREEKWLVRYEDDVTKEIYTFTIPCADKTAVNFVTNTDFVEITAPNATPDTVVTVGLIEAFVASPAGNEINVLDIKYVGRNL